MPFLRWTGGRGTSTGIEHIEDIGQDFAEAFAAVKEQALAPGPATDR